MLNYTFCINILTNTFRMGTAILLHISSKINTLEINYYMTFLLSFICPHCTSLRKDAKGGETKEETKGKTFGTKGKTLVAFSMVRHLQKKEYYIFIFTKY